MAESKFTPGTWSAEKATEGYSVYWWILTKDQFIARTSHICVPAQEQQANAELMADAPRMLEVLRTLHDFALPLRHIGLPEASAQALADARALLEKHGG
jgi:hypothetical protein